MLGTKWIKGDHMDYILEKNPKDLWKKDGYEISGVIATTFTQFDRSILKGYLNSAGFKYKCYFSNIFLFECNPKREESRGEIINKRLYRPQCSITCKECIEKGNRPEMYFHPKLWLLRFHNNEEVIWRVVVSSRNFSAGADNLMDGFFSVDSKTLPINVEGSSCKSNELANFVRLLLKEKTSEQFDAFYNEICNLSFSQPIDFIWNYGPDKKSNNNINIIDLCSTSTEIWINSPFINGAFIEAICKEKPDKTLHILVPSPEINYLVNELGTINQNTKINYYTNDFPEWHAKQYIIKKDEEQYYFVTGSHNATYSAMCKNAEFSVVITIKEEEKNSIVKNWEEFFPYQNSINGESRPENKKAEMFNVVSNHNNPVEDESLVSVGNKIDAQEMQDLLENAVNMVSTKMFGNHKYDFDLLLKRTKTEDLKGKDIGKIIESIEKDAPRMGEQETWKEYKKEIRDELRVAGNED